MSDGIVGCAETAQLATKPTELHLSSVSPTGRPFATAMHRNAQHTRGARDIARKQKRERSHVDVIAAGCMQQQQPHLEPAAKPPTALLD